MLFFFLPQNTNHKLHGWRQTQGKIKNKKFKFKFKIKILQYYVFIQEYSHIFSVITTNWKPQRKKPYRVAFSLYKHQESFICPLLRSWKRWFEHAQRLLRSCNSIGRALWLLWLWRVISCFCLFFSLDRLSGSELVSLWNQVSRWLFGIGVFMVFV